MNNIDKLQKIIQKTREAVSGNARIVLDTNMYIFWYEFQLNIIKIMDKKDKIKKELVGAIFQYLQEKQIKVILLNIIKEELKIKFKELNEKDKQKRYKYSESILFDKLNIEIEKNESKEDKVLAKKLFPEEQHDMIIYLYCKGEKIELLATDNIKDFDDCERIYEQNISSEESTIITSIPDLAEAINEVEGGGKK